MTRKAKRLSLAGLLAAALVAAGAVVGLTLTKVRAEGGQEDQPISAEEAGYLPAKDPEVVEATPIPQEELTADDLAGMANAAALDAKRRVRLPKMSEYADQVRARAEIIKAIRAAGTEVKP